MTREYLTFMESSIAAERSGDAATALEYHRGIPMFTRGRHTYTLTQLTGLADEMTPWLWGRWAAYQSNRVEDSGTESGFITHAAIDYTLRMFYDRPMQAAYDEGRDPMEILKRVAGESWVFQQVCTFELRGLSEFLDFVADGALAENARWARDWENAEMRGLRVEPTEPGRLVVTDLEAKQEVELLNLGAGTLCGPGGFLVGRLVSSGVTPTLMFDTTPVVVDPRTAHDVAATTDGGWITALTTAIKEGRLHLSALESEDRELASDVPSGAMISATARPNHRERLREEQRAGRDVVGRAAFSVLRSVDEGCFGGEERSPYVAAAVLNPHAYSEAQRKGVMRGRASDWLRWAELAPDPAQVRLRRLAERTIGRAA